jgi:ABC-type Fe3+-citrate transport system substrate-binding protein
MYTITLRLDLPSGEYDSQSESTDSIGEIVELLREKAKSIAEQSDQTEDWRRVIELTRFSAIFRTAADRIEQHNEMHGVIHSAGYAFSWKITTDKTNRGKYVPKEYLN